MGPEPVMKHLPQLIWIVWCLGGAPGLPLSLPARAAGPPAARAALPDVADDAWKEVEKAAKPPLPPAEWNARPPTEEERAAFRQTMARAAGVGADRAREFRERFPNHPQAGRARDEERRLLAAAVALGDTTREAALEAAGGPPQAEAAEPSDALGRQLREAAQKAMQKQSEGMTAVFTEFEKGVRELQKQFPDRPEIHRALLEVAEGLGAEKVLAIAREIEEAKTEPQLKQAAALLRRKFERVGKPVDVKFKAVDGRSVDLLALRGKVVLLDFWATWCGPCVREIPTVKAAYARLQPKGFEIVGISFDDDQGKLENFVKRQGLAWPQFFDGQGWGNKFGQEFGITSIPTMWLLDKKGVLRDLNGREDLEAKVEKLLAEP